MYMHVPSVGFSWHSHYALYLLFLVNSEVVVIFSEVPLLLPLPSLKCLNTP